MTNIDWSQVQEAGESPVAGGYVVQIVSVQDNEDKQYLKIAWDFIDGPCKGANRATYKRAGFWPTVLIKSYKQTALSFFKAFKTAVEESNTGYVFHNDPESLNGKLVGVVLGEEEYKKNNGSTGSRLYVNQIRSVDKIRSGSFEVPAKKLLPASEKQFEGLVENSEVYGVDLPF